MIQAPGLNEGLACFFKTWQGRGTNPGTFGLLSLTIPLSYRDPLEDWLVFLNICKYVSLFEINIVDRFL